MSIKVFAKLGGRMQGGGEDVVTGGAVMLAFEAVSF